MTKYIFIALILVFPNFAGATVYYIDFDCVANPNTTCGNGLASTTPFSGIDEFTDVARNAGDIAFVRRGVASTTNITDVVFTSDGDVNNPITITADYDGIWPETFASSTPTATVTFGSKFVALSASSTQLQTPNKWVYFQGDCAETYNPYALNPCEYAYEVASTSPSGLDLYLPYKGTLSGSGINMRIASSAPQWNTDAGDFQWVMSRDNSWIFKGLWLRSTDTACALSPFNSNVLVRDFILTGNGTTDCGIGRPSLIDSIFQKLRITGVVAGIQSGSNEMAFSLYDALIDLGTGPAISQNLLGGQNIAYMADVEFRATAAISTIDSTLLYIRNYTGANANSGFTSDKGVSIFNEDRYSSVGLNSSIKGNTDSNNGTTTLSSSDNLRAGGGPKNLFVYPPTGTGDTGISTRLFPQSYIKLFEYPIYADTSSKTYSMYFMATSSTAFNSAPFTSTQTGSSTPEMYIECEYYNETSGADRFLKRSNTASAFAADGTWDPISVTCQPTQSGILYLRGWYAKPNDGRSNWFYMDTTPVIQ